VEKKSGKLQSSSKSSLNRTKLGTQSRQQKPTSSDIDIQVFEHWLEDLDDPTRESFLSFAKETFSAIQGYLYARFLGYSGSIICVEKWLKANYKKPDHLKILLEEIDEMKEDIRKLREDIENFAVKRDVGVSRIAAMQKELRSTIAQVDSFVSSKDRKGLLMAGADRAIREITNIFKDDPIEGPLQEAGMSVWARMQFED
jgi:hypothetical protein